MNKVFVSGIVMEQPILKMVTGDVPHILFPIDIRHKTRAGKVQHEKYMVNAWHNAALWANAQLKQGQCITVQGYLTQRTIKIGDGVYTFAEITADEFNICRAFQYKEGETAVDNKPVITKTEEAEAAECANIEIEPITEENTAAEEAVPEE